MAGAAAPASVFGATCTDGWPFWSYHHHAATFWPHRDLSNVLMVHYADLLADLEAQIRRVAAFTHIEVAEDAWPAFALDLLGAEAKRGDAAIDGKAIARRRPVQRRRDAKDLAPPFAKRRSSARWRRPRRNPRLLSDVPLPFSFFVSWRM